MPMLDLDYEALVRDPETESGRLLDFLGLPWEEGVMGFHETARSVGTASTRQVRQPIYQDSVERWRRYERHLEPLLTALGRT